jgi:membrane fusion protein, epimerase transport system
MAQQPVPNSQPVEKLEPFRDGRKAMVVGIAILAVTFGGFGAWAALAPLAGAVIVTGTVKVADYRKTVQHLEGGIVREIHVKAGDIVKEGQPLITLHDIKESSVVDALRIQLDSEAARAARLRAERARQGTIAFPPGLLAKKGDPRVAALLAAEQAFFEARRQLVDRQAALLRTHIKQVEEEIRGLEGQVKSADEYISYTREELAMNVDLHEKKFVAYTRLLALKRELAQKEEKRGEFVALIAQAKQKISERELRIVTLYDNYVKEATDEFRDVENRVADLTERLRPTEDQLKRQTITAPIAGEVVDLRVRTVGGVIAPRDPLMDIVPVGGAVIVEGKVRVEDIDEVKVGSVADVQLLAYKRRTTPKVEGKVTYVSGDSLTDPGPSANTYYLAHIELDPKSLAEIGNLPLTPGMPADAFIKTRERTMLQYLLEPITDTLRRAFRES